MMSAFGEQLIFTDADGNMTLNTTVSIINKAQMVAMRCSTTIRC